MPVVAREHVDEGRGASGMSPGYGEVSVIDDGCPAPIPAADRIVRYIGAAILFCVCPRLMFIGCTVCPYGMFIIPIDSGDRYVSVSGP